VQLLITAVLRTSQERARRSRPRSPLNETKTCAVAAKKTRAVRPWKDERNTPVNMLEPATRELERSLASGRSRLGPFPFHSSEKSCTCLASRRSFGNRH
jgi:hypothetical protein